MKRLLLLLAVCSLSGCRSYHYARTDPDGTVHELWIQSLMSDTNLKSATLDVKGQSLTVEGFSQNTDEETVKAITEGIVNGIKKSMLPMP